MQASLDDDVVVLRLRPSDCTDLWELSTGQRTLLQDMSQCLYILGIWETWISRCMRLMTNQSTISKIQNWYSKKIRTQNLQNTKYKDKTNSKISQRANPLYFPNPAVLIFGFSYFFCIFKYWQKDPSVATTWMWLCCSLLRFWPLSWATFWCMASRLCHGCSGEPPLMAWLKKKPLKGWVRWPCNLLEWEQISPWMRSWWFPTTSERSTEWTRNSFRERFMTWRSKNTEERLSTSSRPQCPDNPLKRWGFTARPRKPRWSALAVENFERSRRILCTSLGAVEFGTQTQGAHLGSRIKVSKVEDTAPSVLTF